MKRAKFFSTAFVIITFLFTVTGFSAGQVDGLDADKLHLNDEQLNALGNILEESHQKQLELKTQIEVKFIDLRKELHKEDRFDTKRKEKVSSRKANKLVMDISSLHKATYTLMILFMFIGGASGSTAGGIKVNTLGVLWASIRAAFNRKEEVVIFDHSLSKDLINQAYMITFLSLGVVFTGTLILSLCEQQKFIKIVFETVSAFGTVGLSTGITPGLSIPGKLTLVLTMFVGRVGMLTLVTAFARGGKRYDIRYPDGKVTIG